MAGASLTKLTAAGNPDTDETYTLTHANVKEACRYCPEIAETAEALLAAVSTDFFWPAQQDGRNSTGDVISGTGGYQQAGVDNLKTDPLR